MKILNLLILFPIILFGLNNCNNISSTPVTTSNSVDTNIKVLASNVVVDSSAIQIQSTDAQSMFEKSLPVLNSTIVGRWSVKSYDNGFNGEAGVISLNSDGTFSIESGTISVIAGCNIINCSSTTGVWTTLDESIISTTLQGFSASYAYPVQLQKEKIVFIRGFNTAIFRKL